MSKICCGLPATTRIGSLTAAQWDALASGAANPVTCPETGAVVGIAPVAKTPGAPKYAVFLGAALAFSSGSLIEYVALEDLDPEMIVLLEEALEQGEFYTEDDLTTEVENLLGALQA